MDAYNTLIITSITPEDEGYYVCSGVGLLGAAIAYAHLEVQGLKDLPPPIIALGAPNQTLPLGTRGEMPCEARGVPQPSVTWYKGSDRLISTDKVSITPRGTLVITGKFSLYSGMRSFLIKISKNQFYY